MRCQEEKLEISRRCVVMQTIIAFHVSMTTITAPKKRASPRSIGIPRMDVLLVAVDQTRSLSSAPENVRDGHQVPALRHNTRHRSAHRVLVNVASLTNVVVYRYIFTN
jgi:hypothetical protein